MKNKNKNKNNLSGIELLLKRYRFIRFQSKTHPKPWIVLLEPLSKDGEVYVVADCKNGYMKKSCLAIFHLPQHADENYLADQLSKIIARAASDPMFNM